ATRSFVGGSVGFSRLTGAALLCWSRDVFTLVFTVCGIGEVGRFWFSPRFSWVPPSDLYGALGGRAALDFAVAPPRLFLHVGLAVLGAIHPTSHVSRTDTVFEPAGPAIGGAFGLLFETAPRF